MITMPRLSALYLTALISAGHLLSVVAAGGAVCPNIEMNLRDETCESIEDFNAAFKSVYAAIFNYVEWEEYYGYAPTSTLDILAETSFAQIEEEQVVDERSVVVTANTGGYAMKQGDYKVTTDTNTTEITGRFLEVMKGKRDLQGFDCYPPKQCKDMGWCCAFCPCKNRRLEVVDAPIYNPAIRREAARMEEAAIAEARQKGGTRRGLLSAPLYANVCDWLKAQTLPGCLAGATVDCIYRGATADVF